MNRIFLLAVSGLLASGSLSAQVPDDLSLEPVITSGISGAVGLRHAGDGSGRLFVFEQGGHIKIWDGDDSVLTPTFLTLNSSTPGGFTGGGESGLLGLAFHPEYAANRKLYVNYTDGNNDTRIVEYQASASDPDVVDLTTRRELMTITQPSWNHNGGNLLFGPDGYLYIGMGDGGGSGGSGQGLSQDLTTLLGKMLRIDVDVTSSTNSHACGGAGTLPYGIPDDNPFADGGGCAETVYVGLRNPWRWSFDRDTGDLFIADVGQSAREEVNFWPFSDLNQIANFGWKCFEGTQVYVSCPGGMEYPHTPPILEHGRSEATSITGGYRYRGPIAGLQGLYIYGDYGTRRIWFATESGGSWSSTQWGSPLGQGITSFGEDEEGNVYVVRPFGDAPVAVFHSKQGGPETYIVTPSAGTGGSLDPDVPQEVDEGDTASFDVLADTGYVIDDVTGCGGSLSGTVYTTAPVTADCTVTASFTAKPPGTHVVTPVAGPGGSLDPSTPQIVDDGDTISFDVLPDPGYLIDDVTGCGGSLAGTVYTTGPVTADCDVEASFAEDPDVIFINGFEQQKP